MAVTLALLAVVPGQATTVRALDDEALCSTARQIFHGVCVEARPERGPGGRIVTRYRFAVLEGLKGSDGGAAELVQPGGELGGEALVIPGAAGFAPGEEVVAFVGPPHPSHGYAFTVGLAQGKFRVARDPASGRRLAIRDLGGLHVVGEVDDPRAAGSRRAARDLDELLDTVRRCVTRGRRP